MQVLLFAALLGLSPDVVPTGKWQTDYAKALDIAKQQDKPLFLYFTSEQGALANARFEPEQPALEPFVLVYANKSSIEGKKLFDLFSVAADQAYVVIERGQEWQYCRYERDLTPQELHQVLAETQHAVGKPDHDVLGTWTTSYYPPATNGQQNYGGSWTFGGSMGGAACRH